MRDVVSVGVTVHRSAMIDALSVEATSDLRWIVHFRSYEYGKRERRNDFMGVETTTQVERCQTLDCTFPMESGVL